MTNLEKSSSVWINGVQQTTSHEVGPNTACKGAGCSWNTCVGRDKVFLSSGLKIAQMRDGQSWRKISCAFTDFGGIVY